MAGTVHSLRLITDANFILSGNIFANLALLWCALDQVETLNTENKHLQSLPEVQESWKILIKKLELPVFPM